MSVFNLVLQDSDHLSRGENWKKNLTSIVIKWICHGISKVFELSVFQIEQI